VATLAAVEEVEVDVHGQLVATDTDRERTAHLVDVERLLAFLAGRALDGLAGVGGDPYLGVDPRHLHLRAAHLGGRHDAELGDAMGVALVARPLVDRLGLGDDAVRANLAGLRHLGAHDHQVVELQEVVVVEHHTERARRRMLAAEDPADLLAFAGHDACSWTSGCRTPGCITACLSARKTSPRSPMR
jgi:hypothetical protein